jgi:hypothetical protein
MFWRFHVLANTPRDPMFVIVKRREFHVWHQPMAKHTERCDED